MARSNCILFAYALWWRRRKTGIEGYVTWRASRYVFAPHVLYAERRKNGLLRVVSFVPISPSPKVLPPPLFQGRVQWGDNV